MESDDGNVVKDVGDVLAMLFPTKRFGSAGAGKQCDRAGE